MKDGKMLTKSNLAINFIAPINTMGYGISGYNVLKSMVKNGFDVSMFPIGNSNFPGDNEISFILKATQEKAKLYNPTAPCVRLWHAFGLDMFVGKGLRIGWPIFELNKFNEIEKHHLENVDRLFVCSQWAKDIIAQNNIDVETHVVPLGVDMSIFFLDEADIKTRPTWTKDTTVFLNIGKWEKRKGHFELLEAFNKAFEPGDNVEIWMMNENVFIGHENEDWKRRYLSSKMGRHVKFFPRFDNHETLKTIYNHVDCGIFPSHAEGFNLEPLEAMACGRHIIATNYSGHTEYLTEKNALLLDVTGMESAVDGKWFNGEGEWCTFEIDQVVEHMKTIHKLKQNGSLDTNEVGIETAKKFSWDNTVEHIKGVCV